MFTDVVASSAMTSAHEEKALRLLGEHADVLRGVFEKFNGRVVKSMGDGFLVEFASAVDAVNCAAEAQGAMAVFNRGRAADDMVVIRIGIHVGDVVVSGGDVLGDAVNVAARLQPMADPGGICISRQVVDQVERKVEWKMVKMGTKELKNISYPVELYRVEASSGTVDSAKSLDPRRIAILPFANLSSDPNDRYFADGMTEELISTVSSIGELSVISRTSVMRYKDTTVPIGEIGRELSAGTVLEGSIRKAGNKVRVTTQLIDAQNDRHLWAQSYDRDVTDIFAIQGDIAGQVADALRVKLLSKEKDAIEKKATGNIEAYTLYLKGRFAWNRRSQEGLHNAIQHFKEAVKLDPGFALAYSGLADAYLVLEDRGWIPHSEAEPLARGYALRAVELDPDLAEGHASLGLSLHQAWDLSGAERELKKAIAMKPNYATAYHWYWGVLQDAGKLEEAYEMEKQASRLDPHSSVVRQGIGVALLYLGRAAEAIAEFEALEESDPKFNSVYYWDSWARYVSGDLAKAIEMGRKGMEGESTSAWRLQVAWFYIRDGQKEEALKIVGSIPDADRVSPTGLAAIKFELGETDAAFDLLNNACREKDSGMMYFRSFPWFAEYRRDPRWQEIERKMRIT